MKTTTRHPLLRHPLPRIPLLRIALLLLTLLGTTHSALAYDFEVDGIYYSKSGGTNVAVTFHTTSYSSYSGDVVIPSIVSYGGITYTVTSIGLRAFYRCTELTGITIPNSVTTIDHEAFYGCSGLTSVTIPNSVINIHYYAFNGCAGLTSINVENQNPNFDSRERCNAIIKTSTNELIVGCKNTIIPNSATRIGSCAFQGCTGLTSISIPNSVTSIAFEAFTYCHGLTSINVASENPSYDSRNNCNAIIETSTNTLVVGCKNTIIPNSVTQIGYFAFEGCTGLTSISIPNSVREIEHHAFSYCSGLKSINVSDGNPYFDSREGCNAIIWGNTLVVGCKNTIIPNSVTAIGHCAFEGCTGLTSISIPNSITNIDSEAFVECSNLASAAIGKAVRTIGPAAFFECTSLNTLYFNAKQCGDFNAQTNPFGGCALENITIGNEVQRIPAYFVYLQSALTKVVIPSGVASIGEKAFGECANLNKVIVARATPPTGAGEMFHGASNLVIYVPNRDNYANAYYWRDYNIKGMCSVDDASLTMATVSGLDEIKLLQAKTANETFIASGNKIAVKGLLPGTDNDINVKLMIGTDIYDIPDKIRTKSVEFGTLQGNATQTTLSPSFTVSRDEGFVIESCGVDNYAAGITATTDDRYTIGTKISGLSPGSGYYLRPWVQFKGQKYYGYDRTLYTSSIGVNREGGVGPTSVNYTASYSAGDARVTDAYFTFGGNKSKRLSETGLEPRTGYSYAYTVETASGNQNSNYNFTTPALTMATQTARMLTNTTAMLIAETNMADEETSCGFEWRRYDAPEEMPSTRVYCPVYGGMMAGTLKRMSENVYYKYRPFYRSSAGNEYYGDWVAFITADAGVEFEPVVYTYNSPAVTQTGATLQGVALRGSDDITAQGFEYWKAGGAKLAATGKVTRVTATGERMSAAVDGLAPNTRYGFRAFVTAGGKTKYGDEVEFVTLATSLDVNLDGEINVADVNALVDMILAPGSGATGDVNGDGEVNVADVNAVIDAILSK